MKNPIYPWISKEEYIPKKGDLEMGKEKRYWNHYYKPGQDIYWFQVPRIGSVKFAYDNIIEKNWGRYWDMPSLSPERVEQGKPIEKEVLVLEDVKIGSIILFATPNKIVDLFLIVGVKDDKICLSPVFFTMLWKNINIIVPIPACYQHPQRNHPVKLEDGDKFRDYIEKNKDAIFREVYSWEQ